jgi:flagellar biogenesis protein FliO
VKTIWLTVRRTAGLGVALLSIGGAAFGQTLGKGDDDGISLWRTMAALLLCLTLAVAGAFALKAKLGVGFSPSRPLARRRRMQLVETMRLPNQVSLSIIMCDDRELLVATSAHGTNLIDRLPCTLSEANRTPASEP